MREHDMNYRYLFPFEKIPANSKILIYGAGILGQEYLKQLLITRYCHCIGFLDKNYKQYGNMRMPVYAPAQASELSFDFIVIALRGEIGLREVMRMLLAQGIDEKKIVYVLERSTLPFQLLDEKGVVPVSCEKLAFNYSQQSFAVYVAGGFGDMLIQKRLIAEWIRLVPDVCIDLYAVHGENFLQWLYADCPQIKNVFLDLGTRYISMVEKYSLSIQIIGSGFIEIDNFQSTDFDEKYVDFLQKIKRLQAKCKEERLSVGLPSAIMFKRRIYKGENCYTGFNYGDVFSIGDFHIKIPFLQKFQNEFLTLGLSKYITINVGNGTNFDGKGVSKAWPLERFQKVVHLFKTNYPNIAVVQIGAVGEPLLENADLHIMGKEFGLIAYILKNAIFHLDIEGGLVHLASQIGTKCVVLFGPTSMDYNAYENNINIKIGDCHDCYGYYLDTNHCARDMEEPECMYRITPEIVMQNIDDYMSSGETQ